VGQRASGHASQPVVLRHQRAHPPTRLAGLGRTRQRAPPFRAASAASRARHGDRARAWDSSQCRRQVACAVSRAPARWADRRVAAGRPRTITDEQVEAVIVTTLETTPKDAMHWSTLDGARSWADAVGGVADLDGVRVAAAPGDVEALQAPVVHREGPRCRRVLSQSKQTIDREIPAELAVHVVLDNSSAHKTAAIRNWLVAHPRFVLHFTPTSSSWLNVVERWSPSSRRRSSAAARTSPAENSTPIR
jgi:hypothetical protein